MPSDSGVYESATPILPCGLTEAEVQKQIALDGTNTISDASTHPWRMAMEKVWAPVPWMLEAAILLELAMSRFIEAAIIAFLLIFNAALGLVQESRAKTTLAALKSRLALVASVKRDGVWKTIAASGLVAGDLIKLSLGAVVAADVTIVEGEILVDQSMLTGESVPIEAGPGAQTYAGALVRRGEAAAVVTATGARTKFGRVAELVLTAHVVSSQQKAVLRVVRNLAFFSGGVIVFLIAYAWYIKLPVAALIPLLLTAVLASIPVALPATFTLASAIGARSLAKRGVLSTRLSAVDEAASITILCADKTGTLTQNALTVASVHPLPGFDEARLLMLAALASTDGGQDSVDASIRVAAGNGAPTGLQLVSFTAFDPARKMSEAMVVDAAGNAQRVVKGAYAVVSKLVTPSPCTAATEQELEAKGYRVLAVAVGPASAMELAGFIALSDPPRTDAAGLIDELRSLGVRTIMVTGDAPITAAMVAKAVGLGGSVFPPGPIPPSLRPEQFAVFAGVLPEEKYKLVQVFQRGGHTIGMCGDGANDAPALRQAQMGIAVATASDVAKSAAGMVLTEPGLAGIVAAIKEGRISFQRVQNYALNSIIKKLATVLLLVTGLLMTGQPILTPLLMVIVMVSGDFLTMALTTDRVLPSTRPNSWRVGQLMVAGAVMAVFLLAFCSSVLAIGHFKLGLAEKPLQTLAFITLVFGSQAIIYAIRQRRRLWEPRPSRWLAISSTADIVIAATLAAAGIAMAPLPIWVIISTLAATILFGVVLNFVKLPIFRHLQIA